MPVTEAIILAGGLGTRLREAVPHLPKAMATVAGKPFISFVIDYLRMQGIQKFIFSLYYKAEVVQEYLAEQYPTLVYECVIEEEPLGTGGAIKLCLQYASEEDVLITNGDTLFKISVEELFQKHTENNSACTLALKPMQNFERYGVVELTEKNVITSFKEKKFYIDGLINGGVYIINKKEFNKKSLPKKFSFEKDYLEKFYTEEKFLGCIQDGYFIDIGIPEDYNKAQKDLQPAQLDIKEIDKSWTLFLDRDGVINEEKVGNYILNWEQFIFSQGTLEAFKIFGKKFSRIIVISNQRGVGKGLMTEDDLTNIHNEMVKEVESVGSHIDKIYYCTDVSNNHFNRKPNPGMAVQAKKDFPEIDLTKAIMVGNKPSDVRFGRSAGMFTVFLTTTNPGQQYPHPDIDLIFPSLIDFAKALES